VRHANLPLALEHLGIEPDVFCLARIIELFAQARPDLFGDLRRVDRAVESSVDAEQDLKLLQVGFDRRIHVGILQLAGECPSGEVSCPVHLPEGSGRRGIEMELQESLPPIGAELCRHAPAHEALPHGRRMRLQL
jgi:hypothetical protein